MTPGLTPADWITHHARHRPGDVAFVWEEGRATYETVDRLTRRWAADLHQNGVSAGDRVVSILPNSPELVVAFAATSRLNATFCPLDPRSTSAELDDRLDDLEPTAVVESGGRAAALDRPDCWFRDIQTGGPDIGQLDGSDPSDDIPPAHDSPAQPGDDALLVYSSGTTGNPLASVHTYDSILWNHRQFVDELDLDRNDQYLAVAPMHHIAGLHTIAGPLMYLGGTLRFLPEFRPSSVLAVLDAEPITCSFMVPTMWRELFRHPAAQSSASDAFRFGLVGGAPVDAGLIREGRRLGYHLVEGYGMTEAGPMVSTLHADDPDHHDGGIGRPGMHVAVRAVDDTGDTVDIGDIGELEVAAPNIMDRYWREPDETDAVFRDGWLRTGDLGRLHHDGSLTFAGRLDDMFISGGENIYPAPIERALTRHPDIDDAAVVGTDSERWGQTVTAIIQPADRADPTLEDCRTATAELAHFKRPRRLIRLQSLPTTNTGKTRRDELRRMIDQGELPIDEQRDDTGPDDDI